MHEQALMRDLMKKIEAVAITEGATRVTKISVGLGAMSHFTPHHFREHFVDASRGTIAEGAEVAATLDDDLTVEHASGVVLLSVEVEGADRTVVV